MSVRPRSLAGLVAAAALGGLGVALASPSPGEPGTQPLAAADRTFAFVNGDSADMPLLDLSCSLFGPGDRFADTHTLFVCSRPGVGQSVGIEVTANWVRVWSYSNPHKGIKALLFAHRRNP